MSTFAEYIERLASSSINEEFFNSNESHAQIVLTSMVRHAKKKIRIFSGNMCSEVSNNLTYLNEVKSFLAERSGSLDILFCDSQDHFKTTEIYRLLSDFIPDQVKIKTTKTLLVIGEKPIHFTVADETAFRLETDIEKRMARGNFNDQATGKMLSERFDSLFANALSI